MPPAVLLRRTSRRAAAAALRKAQPWRPLLQPKPAAALNSTASVDPQAICGSNSLVADNSFTNCRIVTTYSNGVSTSCSASKIAANILATAGWCWAVEILPDCVCNQLDCQQVQDVQCTQMCYHISLFLVFETKHEVSKQKFCPHIHAQGTACTPGPMAGGPGASMCTAR